MIHIHDRKKISTVKTKDHALYFTTLRNLVFLNSYKSIRDNLLLPNKKLVSKLKDIHGKSILHHACRGYDSKCIILSIIYDFPNLVTECDDFGEYPFNVALMYHQSETVLVKMMDIFHSYPTATAKIFEVCDDDGDLPLHNAIRTSKYSSKLIFKIIKVYPKAIEKCNNDGQYPVHLAIIYGSSYAHQVIFKLMELFPEAIELPNKDGQTPLDLVASKLADNKYQNCERLKRILSKMNEIIVLLSHSKKHSSKKRKHEQL